MSFTHIYIYTNLVIVGEIVFCFGLGLLGWGRGVWGVNPQIFAFYKSKKHGLNLSGS